MSLGATKSVAQHAHAHTVSVHAPSRAIGVFSSVEHVQSLLFNVASQCAIASY